jgi:MarR family transcriptional regulator, transcriptional regulator for hemolysin
VLEYDFDRSVGCWVGRTAHAFEKSLNERLAPHGITYRQWQVLGSLAMEPQLSQVELAERMRIEPPTLVGILDRMERDGWIRRSQSPIDRRKKIITATAAARPVWKKIVAVAHAIRNEATSGLSKRDVGELERILSKVRDNLQAPVKQRQTA